LAFLFVESHYTPFLKIPLDTFFGASSRDPERFRYEVRGGKTHLGAGVRFYGVGIARSARKIS